MAKKENKKAQSKPSYKKKAPAPQENFSDNPTQNSEPAVIEVPDIWAENEVTITVEITDATAPYNFVSLPEKVLPSEIETVDAFKKHIQERAKISGEIELEIETLTPLFIGGNAANSFSPADKFIIPGSSLRGMFKNIFKIVTCGAFRGSSNSQQKGEDFNDEHIYFRCLMGTPFKWMKDLCNLYKSRMEGEKGKNARPGFLIQTFDNKYFIAPLLPNLERKNDFIMMQDFQTKFRPVRFKDSCVYWDGKIAYILTGNQWANKSEKLLTLKQYEEFKESLKGLTEEQRAQKIEDTNHGKQIIRFVKIEYVDWSKRIELPDEVVKSYEHDRNRRGVNLFKDRGILERAQLEELCKNLQSDVKSLIPCHFLYEDNKVTAFGHGQCFRIPYKNSIGGAVRMENLAAIDFADAVFGLKEFWASRVAFEDAAPVDTIKILATATAHPLMQPNPTSYQLYLKQGGEILNHWDKNKVQLRGYKLYWHNQKWDWQATSNEIEEDKKRLKKNQEPLTKNLTPLAQGNNFKSKIRFQNLSEVELGALLMIFNFKNAAYKIGMGKPFGFGSIKITPKLFVESDDAYREIFDGEGFKNPYVQVDAAKYLDAFTKYVGAKIGLTAWQKIIDELQAILDWKNKPAPEKIKSMSGDVSSGNVDEKFKQRVPLPTIFEVVK